MIKKPCIIGGMHMHTNLKGRIFMNEGISYLVLQDEGESPDWLKVKSLNSRREVRQMRSEEVRRHLDAPAKA